MGVAILLERALPGAKASIRGHIERGERFARAIEERFGICEPRQWRAQHPGEAVERWPRGLCARPRPGYWRTARGVASALGPRAGVGSGLGGGLGRRPESTTRA